MRSAFQRLVGVDSGFAVRSLNGAVAPPSMGIAAPLTKRASSDASHRTALLVANCPRDLQFRVRCCVNHLVAAELVSSKASM
jgi:hypothetical protein